VQSRNRPARRSGPTNTEYHWDYEQCCNVALRHSVISPKTPGKIRLNRYRPSGLGQKRNENCPVGATESVSITAS